MNQEQAKKLVELANEIGWAYFDDSTRANDDHIKCFADAGVYQVKDPDKNNLWVTQMKLCFELPPDHYRPVPERKIDWEKAMKNGAWGNLFLLGQNTASEKALLLHGYRPGDSHPFISDWIAYSYCKPLPDFEIPESWMEDV